MNDPIDKTVHINDAEDFSWVDRAVATRRAAQKKQAIKNKVAAQKSRTIRKRAKKQLVTA